MRIGYLHVGRPERGPVRYGRLLAEAARARADLRVAEVDICIGSDARLDRKRLANAGRELSGADVVHLQYNCHRDRSIWGAGWDQLLNLATFAWHCSAPLVATVHDLYPPTQLRALLRRAPECLRPRGGGDALRALAVRDPPGTAVRHAGVRLKRALQPDVVTAWWLHQRAKRCLVCSEEERRRFDAFVGAARVEVIPHFVEDRPWQGDRVAAKRALHLDARTVTLLGFIHPRKGHRLLVEAMADLPRDLSCVFAGDADADHRWFLDELMVLAKQLGVGQRLRVTGQLSEAELEQYLLATDLAVCPFRTASASGSIATWISAGAAILASDIPLVAEYNRLAPGALATFAPYSAVALADGVQQALQRPEPRPTDAMRRLRSLLLLPAVFERHLEVYRTVAAELRPRAARPAHRNPASDAGEAPVRVLADPAFATRARNPYNWLLYTHVTRLGVAVDEYSRDRLLSGAYDIVHLHWPEHRVMTRWRTTALWRLAGLAGALAYARARGTRVVWTIHNLDGHDRSRPVLERWLWRLFVPQVDGVISLSGEAQALALARFPRLRDVPRFVIPHGHYRGCYPNAASRADACRALGIASRAVVAAFVGQVRAYKNLPGLLAAFAAWRCPRAVLLVGGRPDTPQLEAEVRALAARDRRVHARLAFLPDDELQLYLNAADLVVLPYREVLNSGSALLALSFDRPVLVPRQGALEALQREVGPRWVRTYDGQLTPAVLADAMAWALARSPGAVAPLERLGWDRVASATVAAYDQLLRGTALRPAPQERAASSARRLVDASQM